MKMVKLFRCSSVDLLVGALLLLLSVSFVTGEKEAVIAVDLHNEEDRKLALPAWIKEDYPNPEVSLAACKSTSNRLCDPDGILIDVERQRIITRIAETESQITCSSEKVETQVAVALCNRMDLIPYGPYEDREKNAAEAFAIYLHNQWGVGIDSPCGGTGLLIFFSILDRAFFVSRGKALESILTDRRIDRAMEKVKPMLRNSDYSKALLQLVDELDGYISKGEPSSEELRQDFLQNLIPFSFFAVVLGLMGFQMRQQHREARSYAQVESQLSLLDQQRAEALQGRYKCTSCPICLENFETSPGGGENDRPSKGSDGQPLKLLRCGHVFDETCWSEWVSNGSGNVTRCPICQQDVGGSNSSDDAGPGATVAQVNDETRALRQYNRERNFRLFRLGIQYPQYVRPEQIHRWTQSTYEGSLARDSSFVRNNPRHHTSRSGSSRGGSSSSFGGGSSGGGRGGSW